MTDDGGVDGWVVVWDAGEQLIRTMLTSMIASTQTKTLFIFDFPSLYIII